MKIQKVGIILVIIYWIFTVLMIVSSINCTSPYCGLAIYVPVMPFGFYLDSLDINDVVWWLGYVGMVFLYSFIIYAIGGLLQSIYTNIKFRKKTNNLSEQHSTKPSKDKYSKLNKITIIIILVVIFGVVFYKLGAFAVEFVRAKQFARTNLLNVPINLDVDKVLTDELEYGTKEKCISDEYGYYCATSIEGMDDDSARTHFYEDADDYITVKQNKSQEELVFGPFWNVKIFIVLDDYIILASNGGNDIEIINKYTGQVYYSEWMLGETWDDEVNGRTWTWMLGVKPEISKQKKELARQIEEYFEKKI
jgi:amino acid transporter